MPAPKHHVSIGLHDRFWKQRSGSYFWHRCVDALHLFSNTGIFDAKKQVRSFYRLRPAGFPGAPGPIRTADTRFRRAVLYPLSYEGMWDILLT